MIAYEVWAWLSEAGDPFQILVDYVVKTMYTSISLEVYPFQCSHAKNSDNVFDDRKTFGYEDDK